MQNYAEDELRSLLGHVGQNVQIHRSVAFFNAKQLFIGSHVRIDCFCLLSAGVEGIYLQDYIHIAAGTQLFGGGGKIIIESFANLSSRVSLFTSNDDYKEGYLTNPMIPLQYKKVFNGSITLRKHAIVGCGSVLLPGVEVGLGGSVGALSLVKQSVPSFAIVGGTPAKQIGKRHQRLIDIEKEFLANRI